MALGVVVKRQRDEQTPLQAPPVMLGGRETTVYGLNRFTEEVAQIIFTHAIDDETLREVEASAEWQLRPPTL